MPHGIHGGPEGERVDGEGEFSGGAHEVPPEPSPVPPPGCSPGEVRFYFAKGDEKPTVKVRWCQTHGIPAAECEVALLRKAVSLLRAKEAKFCSMGISRSSRDGRRS